MAETKVAVLPGNDHGLRGKRAVISGSTSGIGKTLALAMASLGTKVVISGRGADAVDDTVREIIESGGSALGAVGDIGDAGFVSALVKSCVATFGGVDILVNNAGIYSPDRVTDCSDDVWGNSIATNLNGVFYLSREALPHMISQRWGRVLTASSLAGLGVTGGSCYAASKAAAVGLSRAIAVDYGPYGITSNTYAPEARTPMAANDDPEIFIGMRRRWRERGYETEAESAYRIGVGPPEGVVPWLLYLCTDAAEQINGQAFAVEARRIAQLQGSEEVRMLYRDYAEHGPWTLDELIAMAPLAFPLVNRWPRRTGKDLEAWEQA